MIDDLTGHDEQPADLLAMLGIAATSPRPGYDQLADVVPTRLVADRLGLDVEWVRQVSESGVRRIWRSQVRAMRTAKPRAIERQAAILAQLEAGHTPKQVAAELGVSVQTVYRAKWAQSEAA